MRHESLMRTPRSVDIEITSNCNLRCSYCSHFSSAGDVNHDLPLSDWLLFFEELNRCAVMEVILSGGEPFIRKDFQEIINGIVMNRMRYSILTNGTLITDELATYIASTKRCNFIQVSIDGSEESIHDSYRGKGSFKRALTGIACLQNHGVPVTVRVTIHKNNVRNLDNIAKLLLEDLGLPSFSTNSASPLGLCQSNSQIQLGLDDRMLAMVTITRLSQQYPGRINAMAGPLAEAQFWSEMERARIAKIGPMAGYGYLTGCNCPMKSIAVRADGIIVPCNLLGHMELGHINIDSIEHVWQSHPQLIKLRERHKIPLDEFEFCRGCDYKNYCTGGCPGTAYALLGKVDHPSPTSCLASFLRQGGKLPDSQLTLSTTDR